MFIIKSLGRSVQMVNLLKQGLHLRSSIQRPQIDQFISSSASKPMIGPKPDYTYVIVTGFG